MNRNMKQMWDKRYAVYAAGLVGMFMLLILAQKQEKKHCF